MGQISEREFEALPLRVHAFLAGVPLHDVWAIDLPRPRAGITLDEFRRRVASVLLFMMHWRLLPSDASAFSDATPG